MSILVLIFIIGLSILFYKKINFPAFLSVGVSIGMILFFYIFIAFIFTIGIKVTLVGGLLISVGLILFYIKQINDWKKSIINTESTIKFSEDLIDFIMPSDMVGENIPINRTEYFNMGTENNISDDVYPVIYNARPLKNEMKFMEYGYLVNTNEIVINNQIRNKNKEDKKDKYVNEKINISFQDLYKQIRIGHLSILLYYKKKPLVIRSLPSNLALIIDYIIKSGWSKAVNDVLSEKAFIDETKEQDISQIEDIEKIFEQKTNELKNETLINNSINSQFASISPGVMDDLNKSQINARFSETNYKVNNEFTGDKVKAKGHGVAGEHAGNALDKMKLRNAKGLGHDNSKNGADRIVNGKLIQTKYCKSAKDSINSVFHTIDNRQTAKYTYNIKSEKAMMIIEVPKDQYDEALREMARKINGKAVPNETDPRNAHKYVKKGTLTYNQSQIAQTSIFDKKAHSQFINAKGEKQTATFLQKLKYSAGIDFMEGAGTAIPGSVISSVWVYWSCRTNGQDMKQSFKKASIAFIRPVAYSGFTYMLASQFAGSKAGKKIGQSVINTQIASKFFKNSQKNATKFVAGGTLVVINAAVTFGPDVYNVLRGKISHKQLVKNTVTTSLGAAGGMALGSIFAPGIGTIIGGTIGGTISSYSAKKIMDSFIEDDAVEMIRIAKEEFIDNVIMNGVDQEEFEYILNETFLHKNFNKMLKVMFVAESSREFIRNVFSDLVIKVFKERKGPEESEIIAFIESVYDESQEVA